MMNIYRILTIICSLVCYFPLQAGLSFDHSTTQYRAGSFWEESTATIQQQPTGITITDFQYSQTNQQSAIALLKFFKELAQQRQLPLHINPNLTIPLHSHDMLHEEDVDITATGVIVPYDQSRTKVGYASYTVDSISRDGTLEELVIDEPYRRRGYGKELFDEAKRTMRAQNMNRMLFIATPIRKIYSNDMNAYRRVTKLTLFNFSFTDKNLIASCK